MVLARQVDWFRLYQIRDRGPESLLLISPPIFLGSLPWLKTTLRILFVLDSFSSLRL